jgi:hypothetical protein
VRTKASSGHGVSFGRGSSFQPVFAQNREEISLFTSREKAFGRGSTYFLCLRPNYRPDLLCGHPNGRLRTKLLVFAHKHCQIVNYLCQETYFGRGSSFQPVFAQNREEISLFTSREEASGCGNRASRALPECPCKFKEIPEDHDAVGRHDGFRVKLQAVDRIGNMLHGHDLAVVRFRNGF